MLSIAEPLKQFYSLQCVLSNPLIHLRTIIPLGAAFFKKTNYVFLFFMCTCFTCMYISALHMCFVPLEIGRGAPDPLELELQF